MKSCRVVIFGYSKLGEEVAEQLVSRRYKLLVVDTDKANLERARKQGHEVAEIDYTDDKEMRSIGLGGDVDILFSLFPEDADNVFVTIAARALDERVHILAIAESPESAYKLKAAGANKIIDPFEISGRRLSDLLYRPMVVDILDKTVFGKADLQVAEVQLSRRSPLLRRRLEALRLEERFFLIILGIIRGGTFTFATKGRGYPLEEGDVLVVIGPGEEVERFQRGVQ